MRAIVELPSGKTVNWPYQLPPKETIGIVLLLIVLVALGGYVCPKCLYADINFGFGAGWKCLAVPQGEPVCVKDQSK